LAPLGIFRDDRAVAELPLRLVAYSLLAAAFAAVAFVGLSHSAPASDRAGLERGLGELAAALEGLRHGAARNPLDPSSAGAVRSVALEVPDGAWLSLGGDPDPDGDGRLENGTPVAPEAAAVHRVAGDAKRRFLLPLGIREGLPGPGGWLPASEPLVLGPGNHLLGLEAILDPASGERAALVRAGDNLTLPYLRPS
jgi:hypothetical protein